MEIGHIIPRHEELLKIASNPKIYISRRALKHFVERRVGEMHHRYTKEKSLEKLWRTLNQMEDLIQKPDCILQEKEKWVYVKHIDRESKYIVRVVVEDVQNHKEVKSIHFQRFKKR